MINSNFCCNFCKGDIFSVIWSGGKFKACKCKKCGVIQVKPHPNSFELKKIYSEDYYKKWYLRFEKERKEYFKNRLKEIEVIYIDKSFNKRNFVFNSSEKKRLLDVGCGVGLFLEAAKEASWDIEGCDLSEEAIKYAKKKFSNVILCDNYEKLSFEKDSFDLITMWDVVAHMRDPAGYLNKAKEFLKENGLLVIKTPNHPVQLFFAAKLFSFLFNSRALLHIPAQLYHFDKKTLKKSIENLGFKVIKIGYIKEAILTNTGKSLFKNILLKGLKLFEKFLSREESFILYAIKK